MSNVNREKALINEGCTARGIIHVVQLRLFLIT